MPRKKYIGISSGRFCLEAIEWGGGGGGGGGHWDMGQYVQGTVSWIT